MNLKEYIIKIITAVMFTAAGAIYVFIPDRPAETIDRAVEKTENTIVLQDVAESKSTNSDQDASEHELKTIVDKSKKVENDVPETATKIPEVIDENCGLIDINTNDAELLKTLPGIGTGKAEAILEYRRKFGDFQCIEDIMKVPGIKEGIFKKIKDLIDCR